jgi:hypothetical protein
MLKPLLLSGWFRVQPFLNYFVLVMLIAPLIAASGNSTSAKQSKLVAKIAPETGESEALPQETANVAEPDLAGVFQDSVAGESSVPQKIAEVEKQPVLEAQKIESLVVADYSIPTNSDASKELTPIDPLAAVELAPIPDIPIDHLKLAAKFKAAEIESLLKEDSGSPQKNSPVASSTTPRIPAIEPLPTAEADSTTEAPVTEAPSEEQAEQVDPIGSPHPIPWKWIVSTQEAVGSKGNSGVRYYRSVPVISPDGKYAVYSRVKMEIKPEMYNSRVTSVMFIEDRQTKKLRVMASTSQLSESDPLLNASVSPPEQIREDGQIGVLVPVSWSEKSDRFLARKFKGVFNTGDATDHAVIWDRQKNYTNTVAPTRQEDDHEKIAVLLGWSKNQPDHVLFREGEMGEEEWPLVQVATDGKTVNPADADQPVTYGDKLSEIWTEPQVATR